MTTTGGNLDDPYPYKTSAGPGHVNEHPASTSSTDSGSKMAAGDVTMHVPRFGVRGCIVVFGGFLIHLSLGSFYMFGNYSPYMISYLRNRTRDADVENVDGLWVNSIGSANIYAVVLGGIIDRIYGPRKATAIGSLIFCSSTLVTYFAIQSSFALLVFTYGFLVNLGSYMAYMPPVHATMKWLPHRPTLGAGLIVCGFGGGALVFSQVLTAYVNPENYSPDQEVSDEDKYFTQADLLDRVPYSFLLLGAIYIVFHVVGLACICNPPPSPRVVGTTIIVPGDLTDKESCLKQDDAESNTESTPLLKAEAPAMKPVCAVIKEALTQRATYVLWFTIFCCSFAMNFVGAVYKAYGQNFIDNDKFLALTISISSIFNCIGRPIFGLLNDKFGYKVSMWCITAGVAATVGTFSFTERLGAAAFMAWLCAMYLFYSGVWSTMPATFARLFGVENTGITMGLCAVSIAASSIIASVTAVNLKQDLGWHGLFYLSAGIAALGFFLTFFFNGKSKYGGII